MDMLLGAIALAGYAVVIATIITMYLVAFLFLLTTMVIKEVWQMILLALVGVCMTIALCYVYKGL